MSYRVMKLIDPRTGLMECMVCGSQDVVNVKTDSNDRFYRGSGQCQYGCRLETEKPVSRERIVKSGSA